MNKKRGREKLAAFMTYVVRQNTAFAAPLVVAALGGKAKVSVPLRVGDKTKRANQAARPR